MVMAVGLLAAACSDSHGQSGSQCTKACGANHDDAGSAVQGGHDGGFHNAGRHDADVSSGGGMDSGVADSGPEPDAAICNALGGQAYEAVADALVDAVGCTVKSDCELISPDTMCTAGCGDVLVATRDKPRVQAAIAAQNASTCARFADAGCYVELPPCPPLLPVPYDCIAGKCSWLDEPIGDAGSGTDCVVREVSWTYDGGFVAFHDRQTLTPCRHFSLVRATQKGPSADAQCANDVAIDAMVKVADVNAALASEDIKAARADAPVLYGRDTRPVDGSVFRIEIDGATIDIGGDCNGEAGCPAIPAGVAAARQVLEALTMQQRALGSCASLP
jgi:hypothetical protein